MAYQVRGGNRFQQWLDDNPDKAPSLRKRVELRGLLIDPYSPEGRAEWQWLADLEREDPESFPPPPTYEQWRSRNAVG